MTSAATPFMRPLSEVLNYPLEDVAERLAFERNLSLDQAREQITDLKRWLWASALCLSGTALSRSAQPKHLSITPELRSIDEAWHCFLLFTRKYREFCETQLGRFIDHEPLNAEARERYDRLRREDPAAALKERQEMLRPQLEFLLEHLGEETIRRWFKVDA